AVGHSARDTFQMLKERGLPMTAKSFAIGVRIEHPQEMINQSQYGMDRDDILGSAAYKLTYTASNGRGVYTFCMCPG
ncbi:MAG TPA: FAD-dependent oxidoreductase, partial [Lachnospiraceae bacterium]|nr:FAD-dependent oxidoreductase [Lachnospiraceae bacterium]